MGRKYKANRPQYYSGIKQRKKKRYFFLLLLIPVLVIGTVLIIRASERYEIITESPSENAIIDVPPTPAVLSDDEGYKEEAFVSKPTAFEYSDPDLFGFRTYIMNAGEEVSTFDRDEVIRFKSKDEFTSLTGITTYRGDNYRSSGSSGDAMIETGDMQILWSKKLPEFPLSGPAEGTAQPLIIRWPADVMETMTFKTAKKGKVQLTEVIFADNSGYVYFIDLDDGEISRTPMPTIAYSEGTPSLDPRGYPLLYVGQSLQQDGNVYKSRYNYFYIFNLITGKELYRFGSSSVEPFSDSKWQGYGASPLVYDDRVLIPGESGILYTFKVGAEFDLEAKKVLINTEPDLVKYKYENSVTGYQEDFDEPGEQNAREIKSGTTGSLAGYKDYVFLSENSGFIQCIDINHMELVYAVDIKGNGDFTLSIDEDGFDENRFYLYSGTRVEFDDGEKDNEEQKSTTTAYFRKVDGLTGKILWENAYECLESRQFRGGISDACVVGEKGLSEYVIYSVVLEAESSSTKIFCANKSNGEIVWDTEIFAMSESSPTAVYDKQGKGYIVFCDSNGHLHLLDGQTGEAVNRIVLEAGADGSPVIYGNKMVIHLANNSLVCVGLE